MIRIKGNLLIFDKPVLMGCTFPKDCKIDIPEVIPITHPDHLCCIGKVTHIDRDEDSIKIEGEIICADEEVIRSLLDAGELYFSGYYRHVNRRSKEDPYTIDSMSLVSVGLCFGDIYGDNSLRVEEIEK